MREGGKRCAAAPFSSLPHAGFPVAPETRKGRALCLLRPFLGSALCAKPLAQFPFQQTGDELGHALAGLKAVQARLVMEVGRDADVEYLHFYYPIFLRKITDGVMKRGPVCLSLI